MNEDLPNTLMVNSQTIVIAILAAIGKGSTIAQCVLVHTMLCTCTTLTVAMLLAAMFTVTTCFVLYHKGIQTINTGDISF